ncbi:uncharacterized protein BO97DRAFT_481602 [Aspergillus homomorphus CBS 101889]|uniref:Transcription factor domain-containing protein n=1 Tax=Aspergillus homomorphus (strain CBS 101889) TaxID=1450537 RepID=A0A395HGH3_ASPHC|nr:hypothetical protein BO97DRAFT_481602 [Aspergillus homomorphus CBS 101889]RAL06947.1 hypothetical protein BO97DRAFT_481602 [Aspergillus homomorphus CBS 101889]
MADKCTSEMRKMPGGFQFISIQANGQVKDRATRRRARSHAVKTALGKRRKEQQLARTNFIVKTVEDPHLHLKIDNSAGTAKPCTVHDAGLSAPLHSPVSGALDPFQTLAVDSSRLQALLDDYRARQAPEPVFSVAEELAFQNFRSVFRTGFHDPALINAVMLAFAFAVTSGNLNPECLRYQSQAVAYIRQRMDSEDEAASEATIGAILLIAGVAGRLGQTTQVELHMGAVQQLLSVCQRKSIHLTAGIKRAIFWQDLNCSLLAGSKRIVNHATFATLFWARDTFVPDNYRLPLGFESQRYILDPEFSAVLEDLHALQCIRNLPRPPHADAIGMLHINNHTASIQSRLMIFSSLSPVQECCRLAAYLCSITLCCKIWCELVLPSHISSQLLFKVQEMCKDGATAIRDCFDLLVWLLYIGGAFAPVGLARDRYLDLLLAICPDLSWPELHAYLRRYIWSDDAFLVPVSALWREVVHYPSR